MVIFTILILSIHEHRKSFYLLPSSICLVGFNFHCVFLSLPWLALFLLSLPWLYSKALHCWICLFVSFYFVATVNGIFLLISLSAYFPPVCKKATDFVCQISLLAPLLKVVINLKWFFFFLNMPQQ